MRKRINGICERDITIENEGENVRENGEDGLHDKI